MSHKVYNTFPLLEVFKYVNFIGDFGHFNMGVYSNFSSHLILLYRLDDTAWAIHIRFR